MSKAIEIEPRNTGLYISRSNIYSTQNKPDLAINDYTKAIEIEPKNASLYNSRAIYYTAQKQFDLAIKDLTKAIEIEPNNALLYTSRARYYTDQKQFDLAISDYTKAIEIEPANQYHYSYRGRIYEGSIYNVGNLKDVSKAIADSKKIVELDPKDEFVYDILARLIFPADIRNKEGQEEKYLEALKILSRGIESNPNNAKGYWLRGFFLKSNYNYRYVKGKIEYKNKFDMLWVVPSFQMARYDYSKCAELNDTSWSKLCNDAIYETGGIDSSLDFAKQRKDQRNQELLGILGVVVDTVAQLSLPKGNQAPITTTNTQPNTSSRPQITGSSSTSGGQTGNSSAASCSPEALKGIIFEGDGVDCNQYLMPGATVGVHSVTPGTWENCSQPDESGFKYCWGAWQQSGLSQISARLKGPAKEKTARDNPYLWTVGFKNTSSAIVKFSPEIIFGDGTTHPGSDYAMAPGDEIVWHVTKGTSSSSSTASIRIRRYAICTNVSSTTINGERGYKCN